MLNAHHVQSQEFNWSQHSIEPTRHFSSNPKILVIEDDQDVAEAIKYLIESYRPGSNCTIVADPYEALLFLSDEKFDFVLADQRLPGLTGTSVLSQIDKFIDEDPLIAESGHYSSPIPVVFMSGSQISLVPNLNLKNFKVQTCIPKSELPKYLKENFS